MTAGDGVLELGVTTATDKEMVRLQDVVARHLIRFGGIGDSAVPADGQFIALGQPVRRRHSAMYYSS